MLFRSRTVEVLSSLNSLEEINILRQIAPQLPESGAAVKQQYSTLAFIDEWKTDYVKKLVQVSTSDELLALIKVVPSMQDKVLDLCSAKVKMIVEDDLKLGKNSDLSVLSNKITSLKSKWNRIAASENLAMTKVIDLSLATGGKNAA